MDSRSRATLIRQWLTTTFGGRALAGGVVVKVLAMILRAARPGWIVTEWIDSIGDVAIVAAAVVIGYRLFVDVKRVVLWRVRRKLTLSYIFIGFVPALLIITFFLLSGLLLFFNVSAYAVRMSVASFLQQSRYIADSAALEVARAATPADLAVALRHRREAAATRYPLVSYAVVPSEKACTDVAAGTAAPASLPEGQVLSLRQQEGAWQHMPPVTSVPAWVPCEGRSMLVAFRQGDVTHMAARSVVWVPGRSRQAVVVDLPVDEAMLRQLGQDAGIEPGPLATTDELETSAGEPDTDRRLAQTSPSPATPASRRSSAVLRGLVWVAFLDYVNWDSGAPGGLMMSFSMSPTAVYERISGTPFRRLGNFDFGQMLLIVMGSVGALFLVIQLVAFGMGLALARSITGAVHELFVGTERVGRGDFTHKIPIRSRDQLGELASSFNSMTTSIEYLLQEKAEKERLEQELRIARAIQMSLLPQGPVQMKGIVVMPHCEPAREVGGDYYDYLPIDENRLGLLIADVSGKGTSAALYMAELKGVMLSLSQQYTSPRQLLIKANQIISRHLDTRSFITIIYAVIDLRAQVLTYARAGHCPLIHVPGNGAPSRAAQILMPDGMVLGLQIDDGQMFERYLEEATVPLGAGDLFVFYTDGITEAMNADGECFGDARLAALVERHAGLPPGELRERILRDVQAFAGTAAQQDDMTMLLLGVDAAAVLVP